MIFNQIFDMVNLGLVILDKEYKVYKWNRWMELHSGIEAEKISGKPVFDFFPNLNNPTFLRNCKSVFAFGNFSFFSQKLHKYFFPFKPETSIGSTFEFMQQSCTMGPLRDADNKIQYIFLSVQDVTEVVAYEKQLFLLSVKDGLTGVYNRRYLEKRLKDEFERHLRYRRALSLIILDIDFFKKINDTYGHQCGDFILMEMSKTISKNLRKIDVLARYGGEEFCCLILEAQLPSALIIAERLRKTVDESQFIFKGTLIETSISLGVSSVQDEINSPEELLKKADVALYKAKENGRNRVES